MDHFLPHDGGESVPTDSFVRMVKEPLQHGLQDLYVVRPQFGVKKRVGRLVLVATCVEVGCVRVETRQ